MNRNSKEELSTLHEFHYQNCPEFRRIVDSFWTKDLINENPTEIWLHSGLFKQYRLRSYSKARNEEVIEFTSSGTSSKKGLKSSIYTDRMTRIDQQRALRYIFEKYIIKQKCRALPYYVVDSSDAVKERNAKFAAIKGFSMSSKEIKFLYDNESCISEKILEELKEEASEIILIFGFTYEVYKFLRLLAQRNLSLGKGCGRVVLLHGGGWKKMEAERVSNQKFKSLAKANIQNVECVNYYGMIEQPGSIYVECNEGHFHNHKFGEIITRNNSLRSQDFEKPGIIQAISYLPKSYPGHSILTEDVGVIHGIDDCKCGNAGLHFSVLGRLKKAEIRGCSDA